jgi:hypothetical protein
VGVMFIPGATSIPDFRVRYHNPNVHTYSIE